MTMVPLTVNPVTHHGPTPLHSIPNPRQLSTDWILSTLDSQQPPTSLRSSQPTLCETPTNNSTTAAASDALDDDRSHHVYSPLSIAENNDPATTSAFTHPWNGPSPEFVHYDRTPLSNSKNTKTLPTTTTSATHTNNDTNQQLPSKQISSTIDLTPTGIPEWDEFYQEHVKFLQEWYPSLLPTIPTQHENEQLNDNDNTPIYKHRSYATFTAIDLTTTNDPPTTNDTTPTGTDLSTALGTFDNISSPTPPKNTTPGRTDTDDRPLHCQQSPSVTDTSPLCDSEWATLCNDYWNFLQEFYPNLCPINSPRTSEDTHHCHDNTPACSDELPMALANTADPAHDDDDPPLRNQQPPSNMASTPHCNTKWDEFYPDQTLFLKDLHMHLLPTTSPIGNDDPCINNDDREHNLMFLLTLEDLSKELIHLLHPSNADPTPNAYTDASPYVTITLDSDNNNTRATGPSENHEHDSNDRKTKTLTSDEHSNAGRKNDDCATAHNAQKDSPMNELDHNECDDDERRIAESSADRDSTASGTCDRNNDQCTDIDHGTTTQNKDDCCKVDSDHVDCTTNTYDPNNRENESDERNNHPNKDNKLDMTHCAMAERRIANSANEEHNKSNRAHAECHHRNRYDKVYGMTDGNNAACSIEDDPNAMPAPTLKARNNQSNDTVLGDAWTHPLRATTSATSDNAAPQTLNTRNTIPHLPSPDLPTIGAEKLSELKTPALERSLEAMMDQLNRFCAVCDSYIGMMVTHNKYLTSTLEQLVRDMTQLLQLAHMTNHLDLATTMLPPSKRLSTLAQQLFPAPNLAQPRVMTSMLHPQLPWAIPCPPHQQAPYKIHALAPPRTHLPSRFILTQTRQTKDNCRPP